MRMPERPSLVQRLDLIHGGSSETRRRDAGRRPRARGGYATVAMGTFLHWKRPQSHPVEVDASSQLFAMRATERSVSAKCNLP
jgi:hypothetical protein